MAELEKRAISELPENASPSTSAVLVGVDEGETVQIPISKFSKAEHEHKEYAKPTDIPPAYSHPETHPASMITGLSKVATSGSYNDLTDKPTIPSGGGSGSGGGIIDVEADFPSEPSTTSIYRKWQVVKAEWVNDGNIETNGNMACEVVNTLPEVGEICYTGSTMYSYYQRADGECYGYVDSNLSAMMGAPTGWYPAAVLFGALGFSYNGMIDSLADATTGYFLLLTKKPHLYHYYDDSKGNIVKSAIITNDNYEFDENLGTLTQVIVL